MSKRTVNKGNKEFGEFITLMRESVGLTEKELAERLGVDKKTVASWEKGNSFRDVDLYGLEWDIREIVKNEAKTNRIA